MKEKKIKEVINFQSTKEDAGKRLDVVLQDFLDESRAYIQKLIDEDCVKILGKSKIKNGSKIKGNEEIEISILEDEVLDVIPENLPLEIIYQDKDIVIVNKKPNMVVHPAPGVYTGTLVNAILYHIKDLSSINGVIRPGIVHRLDKDTSGIIIIAKNDKAHIKLSEMFKEKTMEKTYICIVKGNFGNKKSGRLETLIGRDPRNRKKMAVVEMNGKNAISNYEVLDEVDNYSLVKVRIETGRTHQIRVHMKHLNHPIVGDSVYGIPTNLANRQMLHAYNLKFDHPITGEILNIIGEIPEDFKNLSKKLKLDLTLL
ncbi:MAG: RluA family pseudouridine synthase [Fusobacteriaceae bacterium]